MGLNFFRNFLKEKFLYFEDKININDYIIKACIICLQKKKII